MNGKEFLNKTKKLFISFFKDEEPQNEEGAPKQKQSPLNIAFTAIGIALCVLLIPIFIINLTLTIEGSVYKKEGGDKVASIFGYIPMVVLSGSMSHDADDLPDFDEGDLIFLKVIDTANIRNLDVELVEKSANSYEPACDANGNVIMKEGSAPLGKDDVVFVPGDVIAFVNKDTGGSPLLDENGNRTYVTHRIVDFTIENGVLCIHTAGDNTGSIDTNTVPFEDIIGWYNTGRDNNKAWSSYDMEEMYKGARIKGIGGFIEWISTGIGVAVIIGVPVIGFIIYDVLRRQVMAKRALKAQLEKQQANGGEPISSLGDDGSESEAAALRAQIEAMKKAQENSGEMSEADKLRAELEAMKKAQKEKEDEEIARLKAEIEATKVAAMQKSAPAESVAEEQTEEVPDIQISEEVDKPFTEYHPIEESQEDECEGESDEEDGEDDEEDEETEIENGSHYNSPNNNMSNNNNYGKNFKKKKKHHR